MIQKEILKWLSFLVALLPCQNVFAQQQANELVNIEDTIFFKYLKERIPNAFVGDKLNIKSKDVLNLRHINVIHKNIKNFKGIEYFVNLEELNATYNEMFTLDLSKNTKLKYLTCWENRLSMLDLSANTDLVEINCGDNQLQKIILNKCSKLKRLYCEQNKLEFLDLSANRELEVLYCGSNKLISLNLSNNSKLKMIECGNNNIVSATKTSFLIYIQDKNFEAYLKNKMPNAFIGPYLNTRHSNVVLLKHLDISSKNIASIQGVEYFIGLEYLDCSNNKIKAIDLSQNVAIRMLKLDTNPLTDLDIRGLRYRIPVIDFKNFNELKQIKIHRNIRDNVSLVNLKNSKGKALTLLVYNALWESADYDLVNLDDSPNIIDAKY